MDNLIFKEVKDTGKTKVWEVSSRHNDVVLGKIGWYPQWRRYVFYPFPNMLFDYACLRETGKFIHKQMVART
nr:hypothetical protein [uncultured Allomuricauda sp.]